MHRNSKGADEMIPTLNVNLKPCNPKYPTAVAAHEDGGHPVGCVGTPVLIPCPLPRTVTFMVALETCPGCPPNTDGTIGHNRDCPARPIRVTCSIGGGTWEHSKPITFTMPDDSEAPTAVADACRERWALVKALVLARGVTFQYGSITERLLRQRDAVFAALVAEVRAAADHSAATQRLFEVLKAADPERDHVSDAGCYALARDEGTANAVAGLQAFVELAIATVGALP